MASIKTNRLMTGPRIIPRWDLVSYHVCRSQSQLSLKTYVTQDEHVDDVSVTHHASRVTPPAFLTEIVFCNLHIIPPSSIFFFLFFLISFASNSVFNSNSNSKSNSNSNSNSNSSPNSKVRDSRHFEVIAKIKFTSISYASVLLLMTNLVIMLSKFTALKVSA